MKMTAEIHDEMKFGFRYRPPVKKVPPSRPAPPLREKVSIEETFSRSDLDDAIFISLARTPSPR